MLPPQLSPYRLIPQSNLSQDTMPAECPHPDAALRGQDADVLALLLGRLYPGMMGVSN